MKSLPDRLVAGIKYELLHISSVPKEFSMFVF